MKQIMDARVWFADKIIRMTDKQFVKWCADCVSEQADEFMCERCREANGFCVMDRDGDCPYMDFKEYFFAEDEEKYFKSKIGDKSDDD